MPLDLSVPTSDFVVKHCFSFQSRARFPKKKAESELQREVYRKAVWSCLCRVVGNFVPWARGLGQLRSKSGGTREVYV